MLFAKIMKVARLAVTDPAYLAMRLYRVVKSYLNYFRYRSIKNKAVGELYKSAFQRQAVTAVWKEKQSLEHAWNFYSADLGVDLLSTEEKDEIYLHAQHAMDHRVNLLGSGLIALGDDIDWSQDYKTGRRWTKNYFNKINYNNLGESSDVKFPWELSRLQWMIPLGQAFTISGDEVYASKAKELLNHWIDNNPFAWSVNWSCTMDVAIRASSLIWFFHVFASSAAWSEDKFFQQKFLASLKYHGLFIAENLEISDINGNHFVADCAGLAMLGAFFNEDSWLSRGINELEREIVRQIGEDGVDFEGSVPYHRFVLEMFLYPLIYSPKIRSLASKTYIERLKRMAVFIAAYTRVDGSAPLFGDADDGRFIPFCFSEMNQHAYLAMLVAIFFDAADIQQQLVSLPNFKELAWWFSKNQIESSSVVSAAGKQSNFNSFAFADSGYYVLRNKRDSLFVDAANVGFAGRGGHGHNDCTSYVVQLDGEVLLVDSGAYLYTASMKQRNLFRSSAYHNVAVVDNAELNRFKGETWLWFLHDDCKPSVENVELNSVTDKLRVNLSSYLRLSDPVKLSRNFELDHSSHSLTVEDSFVAAGQHQVTSRIHLHPEVQVDGVENNFVLLTKNGKRFRIEFQGDVDANLSLELSNYSPSYGVLQKSKMLVANYSVSGRQQCAFHIAPDSNRAI